MRLCIEHKDTGDAVTGRLRVRDSVGEVLAVHKIRGTSRVGGVQEIPTGNPERLRSAQKGGVGEG